MHTKCIKEIRSKRLTLSHSSSNVQSAMVPHALFRRTFLLWTFRTRGRVTVKRVQQRYKMIKTFEYINEIQLEKMIYEIPLTVILFKSHLIKHLV